MSSPSSRHPQNNGTYADLEYVQFNIEDIFMVAHYCVFVIRPWDEDTQILGTDMTISYPATV